MNFSCNNCQRRYSIADEKVRGKTVKVRCKNCQNVITVEGAAPGQEDSTRVVSRADTEQLQAKERAVAQDSAATVASPVAPREARAPWEDEPTRALPLPELQGPWFVMVKGKQEGPLEVAALLELIGSGAVSPRSYFWQQGMPDWKRGSDIPALASLFGAPPASAQAVPLPTPQTVPLLAPQAEPAPAPEPEVASGTSWPPEPEVAFPAPSQPEPTAPRAVAPEPAFVGTPWQPEPTARSEIAAEPGAREAEGEPGAAASVPLGELFTDLELPNRGAQASAREGGDAREELPVMPGQGEPQERPAPEDTQHLESKGAETRRGPLRKVAILLLVLGALVGVLYVLSALKVVPLHISRVNAKGQSIEHPLFSVEGLRALKERLLGGAPAPAAKPAAQARPEAPKTVAKPEEGTTKPAGGRVQDAPEPSARADEEDKADGESPPAEQEEAYPGEEPGPSQEEINRVLGKAQAGFKTCIDQGLRKNPSLYTGEVRLVATVSSSGRVKRAVLDRPEINKSELGTCLKRRARRMVFPAFPGEDVDVEIPLILSGSL